MLRAFASGRLFGERYGSGTPWVLALHGWRRDHRDFDAVVGGDEPIDAIALDLPGFGSTPAPPSAWSSRTYADAIAEVLPEMAEQVVVLGHSFGGRIAVELAASQPGQVRALVLSGVPLYRPDGRSVRPAAGYALVRRLAKLGVVSDARLERARQRYGSEDYRAASGVMREVLVCSLGERYDAAIAAVRCPTVLVWGDEDTAAPIGVGRRAASAFADARLVELPGVGHLTPLVAPNELRKALQSFAP